jgi:protein-disulfide isomerase
MTRVGWTKLERRKGAVAVSNRRSVATLRTGAGALFGVAGTPASTLAGTLAVALAVAGCSGVSLPSQPDAVVGTMTGTVASTLGAANPGLAGETDRPAKRFNPFAEDDGATGRRVVLKNPILADVLKPGPLLERSLGRADAPVTVIKYASLTCPYCRKFQLETFPQLKKRYIDTGKVRFILREFPIGFQSGAATVALRCVPAEHYFAAYAALLESQRQWVSQEVRRDPIWQVVKRFGLTRAQFDACYEDKQLVASLKAVKERGRTLGVIGTPNFFVGNKLEKRVLTMTDFDAIVARSGAVAARAE